MNLDHILNELREELRLIDSRIALLSALAVESEPEHRHRSSSCRLPDAMASLRRGRKIGEDGTSAKSIWI